MHIGVYIVHYGITFEQWAEYLHFDIQIVNFEWYVGFPFLTYKIINTVSEIC